MRRGPTVHRARVPRLLLPWLKRAVLARLGHLASGRLALTESGERHLFVGSEAGAEAQIEVHDPRLWAAVALRGPVGAGEAYAHGWWTSQDPTAVVRLMLANGSLLAALAGGLARAARPIFTAFHRRRSNTRAGSQRNIREHYDLGDELFRLFLDESMTYSCAYFPPGEDDLARAQRAKLERIAQRLDLRPEQRVLEIGSGWGSLALHLAAEHGCRVTTTTISASQHAACRARVNAAGLADRVQVLARDYRDLQGRFDRIVSVEMIEAVGADHYDAYFGALARHLAPGGRALVQAITIDARHYERARQGADFIKRYIFPGSDIPSVAALAAAASRAGLALTPGEDLAPHYVRTLHAWAERLRARRVEAEALGFDAVFLRLWDFYFAYCAGGFAERRLGLFQLELTHATEVVGRASTVAYPSSAQRAGGGARLPVLGRGA